MSTYRVRVSLPNIKGFARVYLLDSRNTLYAFHKQMLSDMEFPQDQMVLFKAFDAKGSLVARYATFDLGQGSIEHISIQHAINEGVTNFVYFYDTTNKKSVIITIEDQVSEKTANPTLIESKGPVPEVFLNGYVAFEDLPPEKQRHLERIAEEGDDDDMDDEEEEDADDSDEDFDEKYDEHEGEDF